MNAGWIRDVKEVSLQLLVKLIIIIIFPFITRFDIRRSVTINIIIARDAKLTKPKNTNIGPKMSVSSL